jgi:hypothetical protein
MSAATKTAETATPAEAKVEAAVPKANDIGEATDQGATPVKKSRVQLAHILDINISQARCATHLKHNLGDDTIEGEIKELRKLLKTAKDAGDAAKHAELKDQIAEKSKALVRISSATPIAAAVMMDNLVKEVIRAGMDQAIAGDRKIVEVVHLHENSPERLSYFPLYDKCPSWANYNSEHEDELKKVRAAANKVAKEAREAKKAAATEEGKKPAKTKAAPKAKPAADDDDDERSAGESTNTKTTFYTYVENALKTVKAEELPDGRGTPYSTMRVSNRVREYLSDLVAEAIARMANLARIIVQCVMHVRTMNSDHVKAVVHMLMADAGRTEEQIQAVTVQIDEKLTAYHDHLKSEKDKKSAALDDDQKAEIKRKQLEAELNRKKKQADLAKKRAIEAAQKAKDLSAETSKLEPIVAAQRAEHEAADTKAAAEAAAAEAAAK